MPTIPLYKTQVAMPSTLGETKEVPERIGRTWENLGNRLGVAAGDMQKRAIAMQDKQDTADVINAYSQYRDLEREYRFENDQRKEKDARGMTKDFEDWSEKTKGDILKELSPGAQTKFTAVFTEHQDRQLDSVSKIEAREMNNYIDGTSKAALLEAQGELAANPGDVRRILKDYEVKQQLLYGSVPLDKKMEDRKQIIHQAAEDLASQGRYTESLALIDSNKKQLGTKYSDVKDKVYKLVMDEQDRIDAEAEKGLKKAQEASEDDLYLTIQRQLENPDSVEAPVTPALLNDAMAKRQISREAHGRLKKLLSAPEDYADDPIVLAEIYEEPDPGRRRRLLAEALDDHTIKPETYTREVKNIANQKYKDARRILSNMMKPPPFYMGQDKAVRYAEGMDYFDKLVDQGMDPEDAKNQVSQSYVGDLIRSQQGLPLPKYWKGGNKGDLINIETAEGITKAAYEAGELQGWEYDMQMDLLSKMREMATEVEDAGNLSESARQRIKQAGMN